MQHGRRVDEDRAESVDASTGSHPERAAHQIDRTQEVQQISDVDGVDFAQEARSTAARGGRQRRRFRDERVAVGTNPAGTASERDGVRANILRACSRCDRARAGSQRDVATIRIQQRTRPGEVDRTAGCQTQIRRRRASDRITDRDRATVRVANVDRAGGDSIEFRVAER